MASPVPGKRVSTAYRKPGSWAVGFHTGVDHAAPMGWRVNAVADGVVEHVGWGGWGPAYGVQVIIRHGRYKTMVAHLSKTTVRRGQSVRAGQKIGEVGTTGNSTGPHAHVESRISPFKYNETIVNPTQFYPSKASTGHPTYLRYLKYGTKNSQSVKNLQRALNEHLSGDKLPITGYYGPMTEAKVRRCQRRHGYGPKVGQADPKGKSSVGPRQAAHLKLPDRR